MNHQLVLAGAALLFAAPPTDPLGRPADWIVRAGQVVRYDTSNGPVSVRSLRIEAGATLRVFGAQPFEVLATDSIEIDGTLGLSGFDAPPVFTLGVPWVPEPGARGGPAGGRGGTGSWNTVAGTPIGGDGTLPVGHSGIGGGGGESGWHPSPENHGVKRRAAGGGGGVLGPDRPEVPGDPEHPANLGLVALYGRDGNPAANGAFYGVSPPRGGAFGPPVFVDADPRNDFFGRKKDASGSWIVGELAAPLAGQGGGAGGDGVRTDVWPPPPELFTGTYHMKGGAGGGGGGLGILQAHTIRVGATGRILADGGGGGAGANTFFVNRIGGGGAGGSGGMILLQARCIDLFATGEDALSCRGGSGGAGADNVLRAEGGGGHGGPGLIQLHVPGGDEAGVWLPPNLSLEDLSTPPAHVLDFEPGL